VAGVRADEITGTARRTHRCPSRPRQFARRFSHRSEPLDDLVQVGCIGLIKAVDRFDPEMGTEFVSYAATTVIGELKRHFRDHGWSVRAPRRLQELYLNLGPAIEELSQRLRRAPTVRELAAELDTDEDQILEALEASHAYRTASLDAPSANGSPRGDLIGDLDNEFATSDNRDALMSCLNTLPERERSIVIMRFVDDLTQSEIAARIGLSQMHVSRLLAKSLAQLHDALQHDE